MKLKALTLIAAATMILNVTGCTQTGDSGKSETGQSVSEQTKGESSAENVQSSDGDGQILTKGPHGEQGVNADTIT